jgi:hypothetical protein
MYFFYYFGIGTKERKKDRNGKVSERKKSKRKKIETEKDRNEKICKYVEAQT